ncbi:DUF4890 domain-containing protein [Xylanibacter ruminicola]|uniref:LTXXQ motif family protein n=1 Tax=Xylanibacter ruminicola TaxID=839 RepID=A0A1M6XDJ9_XYLRU|nr:DUF4890 domain-containing protein [Xylanibacter ruminicola]SHL03983.1 protein of unknown function [Xylanibacter ruminicola]
MKKIVLMMVALMMLTMAQAKTKPNSSQKKMTHSEMTTQMTSKLKLNDTQKKKVAALNKEYESVLQGPGMCDQKNGKQQTKKTDNKEKNCCPEMTDAQKTQMKQQQVKRQEYELKLKKILTDDQYKSYQKMQPQQGNKQGKDIKKKSSN